MSEEYIKLKLYSKFDKMATSKGDENLSTKSNESTVGSENNLDALDVSFNRATVLYLTAYQIFHTFYSNSTEILLKIDFFQHIVLTKFYVTVRGISRKQNKTKIRIKMKQKSVYRVSH